MSGKINVGLKVKPLSKVELRATNAGEFVANMGFGNEEVRIAQIGFQKTIFERVVVYATDENGRAREYAAFGVSATGDDNDLVGIDADDTVSAIQRTDRGAAEGLARTYARFQALGLNPILRFYYRSDITPELRARYNAELGLVDREPVQVATGYTIHAWNLTPAKDRGQFFVYGRGRTVG